MTGISTILKPAFLISAGNETVHALERHQGLHADAAHRLQGAACVAHAIAHKPAAHEIRDRLLSLLSSVSLRSTRIAADEISAVFDLGKKPWDVPRIVLQVAIKQHNRLAPGSMHPGEHRRALAGIPLELKHPHAWIALDALDRAVR